MEKMRAGTTVFHKKKEGTGVSWVNDKRHAVQLSDHQEAQLLTRTRADAEGQRAGRIATVE